MKPETRMGLVAVAVVGGGALLLGGVVLAVALGRSDRGTGGTPDGPRRANGTDPVSTGAKDDDLAYIAGHRWWRKKPSRSEVERLAEGIIGRASPDRMVFVDDAARVGDSKLYGTGSEKFAKPKDLGDRYFVIRGNRWDARPTKEQALRAIRAEIDGLEYKEGGR